MTNTDEHIKIYHALDQAADYLRHQVQSFIEREMVNIKNHVGEYDGATKNDFIMWFYEEAL